MIYPGDMFPRSYRGKMFTCNTHGKRVNVDALEHGPRGVVGRHDPDFLDAADTWFRGIELVRALRALAETHADPTRRLRGLWDRTSPAPAAPTPNT